jgi:MFS family permease
VTARAAGLGALTHRNFRLFFFGQGISLVGTWMQTLALGWLVLELTNSPFAVGLNSALRAIGVLVFTLYAGVVADRVDKRRLVIVTQALQMVEALTLAVLVWTGVVAVWQVMVLAAFVGVVNAFDIPTRQSFIVELVGKDDLMNAIALNSSAFNAARVVGPAVGGALIGLVGVGMCFFLNGISYVAVIAGLLAMRLPAFQPRPRTGTTWAGFREVVAFLREDRRVGTLVLLTAVLSVFGFPFLVMMPVVARDVLHVGATGFGALTAAVGVGAMVGALAIAVNSGRIRSTGRLMAVGGTSFGVLLVLFALSRSFVQSLLLLALTGCAMIVNNALTNTMLQTSVPDGLRGRVMGFYSFVFVGMSPLGALQAGALAERFGAPWAVGVGGAVCALAVTLAVWLVPSLRHRTPGSEPEASTSSPDASLPPRPALPPRRTPGAPS